MDPLEALRNHGPHAEQQRPLGRPVARASRAVFLARDRDQRHALGAVAFGSVEDRHLLSVGKMRRPVALACGEQVAQPNVGEGAAHQDLVVATPRPVAVELGALDAVRNQVLPGGAVRRDAAGGGDVVGRDRVADDDERPRAHDFGQRSRRRVHLLEERRLLDVGGGWVPFVNRAGGC